MSEQQPEYVWAFPPEKPKRGRVWLIVALAVVAVAIVGVLLWAFLRPGTPVAGPTSSTSASPAASASPTPTPTTSPTPEPTPTQAPITSAPPVPDPDLGAFRDQVSGWLDDALTGLDIVSRASGQDAVDVISTLQEDAQRLAGTAPPSSISGQWGDGVADYSRRLSDLSKAASSGSALSVNAARTSVANLRALAGM
ncbi:hypothetical protein ACUOFU_02170 [Microbacterium arabinogalactanolyticum]|uniref:hypothetical protein n=1 Tax=Microbacterium arabinogalactanolyticum TaxID=69365 RepID=UPI0040442052